MRPLLRSSLFVIAALGATLGSPSTARADDAAAAQALFDEATALKAKEEWAAACPKFESSYKLDPALGTLLNLANCFEKVGKIASAWARFEEAYQWATKNGDDRAEYAKKNRDALAPRLPRLKITVANPVQALSIERDTVSVVPAMYGSELPVDPGEHTVFVKRDDDVLKTEKIKVVEAQSAEVKLDLAAIEKAAPPRKPKKDVVVVGPSPALRKAGWGVGAAGLAGVVAAGAIEIVALSKKSLADDPENCFEKLCTPAGKALADEAKTLAEVGQWVGIGSLVVTAVGVTLLIVTPSTVEVSGSEKKEGALRGLWAAPWVAPEPGPGDARRFGGGLVVGGHL
jgi:tetratricopeptide (TPR) repeat protein